MGSEMCIRDSSLYLLIFNQLPYLRLYDTLLNEGGPRSNTVRCANILMNRLNASAVGTKTVRKALVLTILMVVTSLSPLMIVSPVSAHLTDNETVWPKQASNDTGWVQLDAVGADPSLGLQASANWGLEFAPGALLSNVTMEVRVNGSSDLIIEEPVITASDVGVNLFDWSGLGMLGSSDSFTGSNPHAGRLSPNSESGAYWTLPSGAEINELIIEALAPVDPAVTFEPVDLEITDYVIHFVDGRLYLAISNTLLIVCLLYTSPSPRDLSTSRMPSSA